MSISVENYNVHKSMLTNRILKRLDIDKREVIHRGFLFIKLDEQNHTDYLMVLMGQE